MPVRERVGSQHAPDGLARSVDALESMLAAVGERVARLEADVRNLQSRNANRA